MRKVTWIRLSLVLWVFFILINVAVALDNWIFQPIDPGRAIAIFGFVSSAFQICVLVQVLFVVEGVLPKRKKENEN